MSNGPAGASSVARHRCWLLCESANYAPLLDAALTFNAAALTRQQMQLSNTAAPTQSEGAVCQWPLIQKNSFKEAAARLHLLQEIADAIVPTSHQGTAHSVPLSSESQDMNYLKTVQLLIHNHQLLCLSQKRDSAESNYLEFNWKIHRMRIYVSVN